MAKVKNGIRSYTTTSGDTRYSVVMKVQGKTVSKGGFTTKGAAERWRDVKRADVVKGDWIDPAKGRIKFGAFAEEWIATAPKLRQSTRANYTYLLNHQLSSWKDVPLAAITPADVRRWEHKLRTTPGVRTKRPPAEASVSKALRLMKRLCKVAVSDRLIPRSPCVDLEIKQDVRPSDLYCPTYGDVLTIADAVPDAYRALVLLAGLDGLRWGEAIALTRRNVDVSAGHVSIRQIVVETVDHQVYLQADPKTAAGERKVELHPVTLDALARHLLAHAQHGADGLLFVNSRPGDGMPYLRRTNFAGRVWKPAFKKSGLPKFRFHDLRHAAATMAAQTGAYTTADLMKHLGHSTPSAAMRYQHAHDQRQAEGARRRAEMFPPPAEATGTDNVVPLRPR
jgi:integrase